MSKVLTKQKVGIMIFLSRPQAETSAPNDRYRPYRTIGSLIQPEAQRIWKNLVVTENFIRLVLKPHKIPAGCLNSSQTKTSKFAPWGLRFQGWLRVASNTPWAGGLSGHLFTAQFPGKIKFWNFKNHSSSTNPYTIWIRVLYTTSCYLIFLARARV